MLHNAFSTSAVRAAPAVLIRPRLCATKRSIEEVVSRRAPESDVRFGRVKAF